MKFKIVIIITYMLFKEIENKISEKQFLIKPKCTEVRNTSRQVYIPYEESYRSRNWLGITRQKTRLNYKIENRITYSVQPTCCAGYAKSANDCAPICTKSCSLNAICSQPEVCICDEDYFMDPSNYECKPICKPNCLNGDCTSPNTCTCHEGFELLYDNYTCVPHCHSCSKFEHCIKPKICRCNEGYSRYPTERLETDIVSECKPICNRNCVNADCIEPNICKCHTGYIKLNNDTFTCEPECSRGCKYGYCTGPEKCTCFDGYQIKGNNSHVCQPICTEECINGECISPEVCSCYDGFIETDLTYVCQPYCSNTCINGQCTAPESCTCNTGYISENKNNSTCEPVCNEICVNGNCTAPNSCTCFEGYRMAKNSSFICEPYCSTLCSNGLCTAPNECTCNAGYEKINSTLKDSKCIVICECDNGNCNETSSICENCIEGYDLTLIDNRTVCKPHCEGGCLNGQCVEPQKCECNEFYVSNNDTVGNPTCLHACGEECIHGTCLQDNGTCSCFYGWSGRYCNEPTMCALNVSKTSTLYLELNESDIESTEVPWTGEYCNNYCFLELNNLTNCVHEFENQIHIICFINIDSRCNIYSFTQYEKYKSEINIITIASVLTLLLVSAAISMAFFIRRRRKFKLMQSKEAIKSREQHSLIENEKDGISL